MIDLILGIERAHVRSTGGSKRPWAILAPVSSRAAGARVTLLLPPPALEALANRRVRSPLPGPRTSVVMDVTVTAISKTALDAPKRRFWSVPIVTPTQASRRRCQPCAGEPIGTGRRYQPESSLNTTTTKRGGSVYLMGCGVGC